MKKIWVILAIAVMAALCFVGCNQEPAETEPPVMEAYWNVDGERYNDNGVSSRPVEADGTYKVMFAHKGKATKLTVKGDKMLIDKIDSMTILGVVKDDSGAVVDVKTVEDMGGKILYEGYELEAGSAFEMNVLDPDGKVVNIKTPTRSCYVTDLVSDPAYPQRIYPDTLIRGDKIVAVQDYAGTITDVFFYAPGLIRSGIDQYCPHCCEEGETVHFEAWMQYTSSVQESAHYFLFEDLELADQLSTKENVELVMDLNGFTISVLGDKRVSALFSKGSYFGLLDSSEAQTGKMIATSQTYAGQGAVVWVRYGTFEMFSGTLDASQAICGGYGAVVNIPSGSTFNMYGGTIIGGTSIPMEKEDGTVTLGGHGGSVLVQGTFNMYGGTIRDGKAYANGTNRGRGGNIALMSNGVFNMYGGEVYGGIADGTAENSTGDLYKASSAKFNQYGGSFGAPLNAE